MRSLFTSDPFGPRFGPALGQVPVVVQHGGFKAPWGGSFFALSPDGFLTLPTPGPGDGDAPSPEERRARGMGQAPVPPAPARMGGPLGQQAKEEPPALSPVRQVPWYMRVGTPAMLGQVPLVPGPGMARAASRGTRAVEHPYFGPGVVWPTSPVEEEHPVMGGPPVGPRWGVYQGRYVRWPECDPRYDAQCPFPTTFIVENPDYPSMGRSPGRGYPVANLGWPTSHGTPARGRDLWYHPNAPCPPGQFRPSSGAPCVSERSEEDWGEDYWVYGDRDRYVDATFRR